MKKKRKKCLQSLHEGEGKNAKFENNLLELKKFITHLIWK